jgi:glycine reductase
MEGLPRVAYVYQVHSHQFPTGLVEPILYGDNVKKLIPTILHPNEVLDGAVVRGYWGRGQETYSIQNHPLIKELYSRHGKELCFVGVVVTVAQSTEPERERAAAMAANLVKWVLGADGAVLTKIGGGAPHIDLAQTCERLEELGVKTAVIVQDMSFDSVSDGALIFNTPEANAIVNIGSYGAPVTLPPMERVIGGPVTFPGNIPADGALRVQAMNLGGAMSQIGGSCMVAHEY